MVLLHADTVAEQGAAGVGAAGIDGDDGGALPRPAQPPQQPIGERALAGAGRAGDADDESAAGVGEERAEQLFMSGRAVLDGGGGAGQGPAVAGEDSPGELAPIRSAGAGQAQTISSLAASQRTARFSM
jgi:hypothetical protein